MNKKDATELRELREPLEPREPRELREPREPREPGEPRELREPREHSTVSSKCDKCKPVFRTIQKVCQFDLFHDYLDILEEHLSTTAMLSLCIISNIVINNYLFLE